MDPNIQNHIESNPQPYQYPAAENQLNQTPSKNSTKIVIIIIGVILLLILVGEGLYIIWHSQTTHNIPSSNSVTPTIHTNTNKIQPQPTDYHLNSKAPDLTTMVKKLTSSNPIIQEQALAPGGVPISNQPRYVLPVGSTLKIEPNTWEVTGRDAAGAAASGSIKATLTYPKKSPEKIVMEIIKLKGQWYLYETIMPSITP